jgi:hypothetical protein
MTSLDIARSVPIITTVVTNFVIPPAGEAMRTREFDVNVRVRIAVVSDLDPVDVKAIQSRLARPVAQLIEDISKPANTAALLKTIEIVDIDSLPQAAPLCAKCSGTA